MKQTKDALSQDRRGDERAYRGLEGGTPEVFWQFNDLDLAKVAESMGGFGIPVEKASDIQSALEQALASGRPAVVDVVTDQYDSENPQYEVPRPRKLKVSTAAIRAVLS